MTDFNGRPVLVTGASGGIGGATVRHLVEAGADVIVLGKYGSGILDKELDANQTKRFGNAAVPWSSQALA
jgi:NAD(P)-dependent dehydrogenase (short-subunit alcohol dehydrogenase family)